MSDEKLPFRGWDRAGLGKFDAPDVFFGLEAEDADLIGLGGANLADPDDPEAGLAPAAADFDGLARGSQEADAVQTRAILAEIDGVGALGKRIAVVVRAFDEDAKGFGNARLFAVSFPKVGDGFFEG